MPRTRSKTRQTCDDSAAPSRPCLGQRAPPSPSPSPELVASQSEDSAATEPNPTASALQALDHNQDEDRDEDENGDDERDGQRARASLDSTVRFPMCHSCRRAQRCNDASCQRCACNALGVPCRQKSACKSCGSDTGVWCPQCLQDRCGLEWSEYLRTPSWECDHCRQCKSHGSALLPVFCLAPRCLKEEAGLAPSCLSKSVAKAKGFESTVQLFQHTIQHLYDYYWSSQLKNANGAQAGGAVRASGDFKSWIKRQSTRPGRAVNIFDLVHQHQMAELENQGTPPADVQEPEGRLSDTSDQDLPDLIVDESTYNCAEDETRNGHQALARRGEETRGEQSNKRRRKKTDERPWKVQRKRKTRPRATRGGQRGGRRRKSPSPSSESDIENFIAREDSVSPSSPSDDRPSRRLVQSRGLQQQKIQRRDQRHDTTLDQVYATLSSLSDSVEHSCLCRMLESAVRNSGSGNSFRNIGTVKVYHRPAVDDVVKYFRLFQEDVAYVLRNFEKKKARATYHLLGEITSFCQSAASTLLQTKSVEDMETVFGQCRLLFTRIETSLGVLPDVDQDDVTSCFNCIAQAKLLYSLCESRITTIEKATSSATHTSCSGTWFVDSAAQWIVDVSLEYPLALAAVSQAHSSWQRKLSAGELVRSLIAMRDCGEACCQQVFRKVIDAMQTRIKQRLSDTNANQNWVVLMVSLVLWQRPLMEPEPTPQQALASRILTTLVMDSFSLDRGGCSDHRRQHDEPLDRRKLSLFFKWSGIAFCDREKFPGVQDWLIVSLTNRVLSWHRTAIRACACSSIHLISTLQSGYREDDVCGNALSFLRHCLLHSAKFCSKASHLNVVGELLQCFQSIRTVTLADFRDERLRLALGVIMIEFVPLRQIMQLSRELLTIALSMGVSRGKLALEWAQDFAFRALRVAVERFSESANHEKMAARTLAEYSKFLGKFFNTLCSSPSPTSDKPLLHNLRTATASDCMDIFKIGLEELWQYIDFVKKLCKRSRSSLSEIEHDLHNVVKSMPENIHDFRSDVLLQALRVIDLVLSSFKDDSVIETLEWARDAIGTRVLKTIHSSAGTSTANATTPLAHAHEAWELSVSVWIRLSKARPLESFRMMRSAFGPGSDAFKRAIDSKSTEQLQFQWLCLSQFLKTYGIDPNVSKAGDLRSALFVWVLVIRTLHVTTDYSACEALLESRKAPESKEPTLFSILVEYIRAGDIGQLLREMHVLVQSARLADVEISLLVDALTSLLKERFRGRSFYFPLLIHTTRMLCHLPKHVHHVPYLVNSLVLSEREKSDLSTPETASLISCLCFCEREEDVIRLLSDRVVRSFLDKDRRSLATLLQLLKADLDEKMHEPLFDQVWSSLLHWFCQFDTRVSSPPLSLQSMLCSLKQSIAILIPTGPIPASILVHIVHLFQKFRLDERSLASMFEFLGPSILKSIVRQGRAHESEGIACFLRALVLCAAKVIESSSMGRASPLRDEDILSLQQRSLRFLPLEKYRAPLDYQITSSSWTRRFSSIEPR